ncbi:unnamed protein product [Paramecium sonneborni]|uniref:Uncharacterized protein n=1 Tax=Paramecium sonneborni TaxID=65129 RepID=A0A8S1NNI3_9CILI|nr:unnamed protein product [Paramecium sonneborni]
MAIQLDPNYSMAYNNKVITSQQQLTQQILKLIKQR